MSLPRAYATWRMYWDDYNAKLIVVRGNPIGSHKPPVSGGRFRIDVSADAGTAEPPLIGHAIDYEAA